MQSKNIIVIVASLAIITFLIFSISPYFMKIDSSVKKAVIEINSRKIDVEIADNYEKQVRGLMFHEPLRENEGMLFIYNTEGYYGIWMPNVSFPIDILWISKELEIVHIERNAPPCESIPCKSYKPPKPALYVLELKANSSVGINIGDIITFRNLSSK